MNSAFANTTAAVPMSAQGEYALTGHKWFFSAPMSDGFLVLAQAPAGLSCFPMPRRLPDGRRNGFALLRLKDKLGDWSNASSEVQFDAAWARRIGDIMFHDASAGTLPEDDAAEWIQGWIDLCRAQVGAAASTLRRA